MWRPLDVNIFSWLIAGSDPHAKKHTLLQGGGGTVCDHHRRRLHHAAQPEDEFIHPNSTAGSTSPCNIFSIKTLHWEMGRGQFSSDRQTGSTREGDRSQPFLWLEKIHFARHEYAKSDKQDRSCPDTRRRK
jgi:hypothetical protein